MQRYTQFILRYNGEITDIMECLHGTPTCRDFYRFASLRVREDGYTLEVTGTNKPWYTTGRDF